jgi:hypothetical protein
MVTLKFRPNVALLMSAWISFQCSPSNSNNIKIKKKMLN